jgi:hypothetical protein
MKTDINPMPGYFARFRNESYRTNFVRTTHGIYEVDSEDRIVCRYKMNDELGWYYPASTQYAGLPAWDALTFVSYLEAY